MRQIVLDTETTGISFQEGHRIIEIGCIELLNRRVSKRHFHCYINPERKIDAGAQAVHGITLDFLKDKPIFSKIVDEFLEFIRDAELIIHNASFDLGFLNGEIKKIYPTFSSIESNQSVVDTLMMARKKHAGQKNSLDALCKRYNVNLSERELHGALLDARLLAQVYLAMTGGQINLLAMDGENSGSMMTSERAPFQMERSYDLPRIKINEAEEKQHEEYMQGLSNSASY